MTRALILTYSVLAYALACAAQIWLILFICGGNFIDDLVEKLGDDYTNYQKRVRKIIPLPRASE